MRAKTITKCVAVLLAVCASAATLAQTRIDLGAREYRANCAVCHGETGTGAGYYEGFLTRKPTDLTVLARANGGTFPYERVYQVIDGRMTVGAHGPRDMPIWGDEYTAKGVPFDPFGAYDPEAFARARIAALADYLFRIQTK